MAKLNCRTVNTAGAKSELDLLTPTETKMLLEFMLYNMEQDVRQKLMIHHPRLYNVLYPGTLKITVQIGSDGRVVCDE